MASILPTSPVAKLLFFFFFGGGWNLLVSLFSCLCLEDNLMNSCTFCNQTQYDGVLWAEEVLYSKIGLLSSGSRSRSQWRFSSWKRRKKWLSQYFLSFWTFATLLGLLVHHHELEGHVKSLDCCLHLKSMPHWGFTVSENGCHPFERLNDWSFTTKHCVVIHHHEPEYCTKKKYSHLQGQGQSESSDPKVFVCPSHIFWTADLCSMKLCMLVYDQQTEYI